MARGEWVTVRGGGAFGLACGYELARRGVKVRLIESVRLGAGSSGGTVGALAPHVPENWNPKKQFQLESLLMAEVFWAGVREAGGKDAGYARLGRIQPLADAAAVTRAEERAAGAIAHWGAAAIWRVAPLSEFGALAPLSPTGLVIHDTLSARAAPRAAGAALAAAITALGGEIVIGDGAEIGPVIHATGWQGLLELNAAFGKTVGGGIKGQSALLRFDAGAVPQVYAESVHIVPHADGTIAIGSTSERDFDAPDTTDAQLDDLVAKARRLCPVLEGAEVVDRWAGVRPRARSRAPMLGEWPGRAGHFIANGGFKIGFGMAPKVAQVMADLVLDGRDAIPEGFRVEDNL
ncbi:NAD(P)/FAD-dependent oxidoreductase [Sedimentimonas flavescens]|uniref:NAD(P)/FAD-dependent oxidoreductase n=1 Tax=Sedimentimonas flavescens TaxID=2851012 RepID=UPI0021A3B496|nr:FAD-binding oxidoreductase [Sedimentimonas flavescens]MCT2539903.1 FAD-binding oxidoreductase [Sedimentimonas flavescens]